LIPDGTVLMSILELDFTQRDGVLNITISESIRDDYTRRPEWINLNIQVLLESKMNSCYILMCTVSFAKKTLNITIHNQYSNLELTSPVYFSNSTVCYVSPSQQANNENTLEASFGIDSEEISEGALLYRLQRKHATITDNQPSSNATSIKDIATNMYILVAWEIRDYDDRFYVCLIEFIDDFSWDGDKLWTLYRKYYC
jgi:hypothetical protein